MPLIALDGTHLEGDLLKAICNDPQYLSATNSFLTSKNRRIHPSQPTLSVIQGEQALVNFSNQVGLYVGSTEATTCIIAVVVCRVNQHAWVAHYDTVTVETIADASGFLSAAPHFQRPELYLAGGYVDEKGIGTRCAADLLYFFHNVAPNNYILRVAAVGSLNTALDGSPHTRQLAVHCSSGEAYPAVFQDPGPEIPRRHGLLICRNQPAVLAPVYNTTLGLLIPPAYSPQLPRWYVAQLMYWLALADEDLLKECSTSPKHESAEFVSELRACYRWLLEMQGCDDATPHVAFQWVADKGGWQRVALA